MAGKELGKGTVRTRSTRARWGMLAGAVAVIAAALVARHFWGANQADAGAPRAKPASAQPAGQPPAGQAPPATGQAAPAAETPQVVAIVNSEDITRDDLAAQCLHVYGAEVLNNLVNRELIVQQCEAQKITITRLEVEQEVERLAQRFGLSTDRWLSMLKEERGISPSQYANDIVWPTLALRKLGAAQLQVTPEELRQAHEAKYGPAVKVRLIACNDQDKAQSVHEQAEAHPEDFPKLARQHSDDPNSASAGGLIQPIHAHVGSPQIERAAFSLAPGQVSPVIPVGHQYIILKCEEHLPARNVSLDQVAAQLTDELRERKERQAAADVFKSLQDRAQIENVFNDPAKSKRLPGVAAVVNGRQVTIAELGEACIERYGEETLTGMITRRILEQACRRKNITISQDDVDQEIERAAVAAGVVDPRTGQPDIPKWLDLATTQQGISQHTYVRDVVWPSVALKKLVGTSIEVTEEDQQKGFEANYGPRVRCQAIVLSNQRRAQEVWEMARDNNTEEYFGDLAEQYSVEVSSSKLHGGVPPIQKHGGQPQLEQEAFALQPGELSGVVQVGDKYIILRCLGQTKPVAVDFAEVRPLIIEDLHEKKLRLAMAETLDRLKEQSQIDNYLAGTVQMPKQPGLAPAPQDPGLEEIPVPSVGTVARPSRPVQRPATKPAPQPQR